MSQQPNFSARSYDRLPVVSRCCRELFCFHACDPCLVALVAKNKIFQIMVLDCGGGTIDITSHLVESSDPLQLSELAEPCGGAWGSSIVDARFKAFLQVSTTQKRGVT